MKISSDCWQCEFEDCGHVWIAASDEPPQQCARCRRRKWHTEGNDQTTIAVSVEPDLARHIAAGHHKKHHRQGNGGRADTRPARGRVGETGESRAAEVPQRAGSSPASPAKLEVAVEAVSAIGETVVPAAAIDPRYVRPEHDPNCRNPYCLVCKAKKGGEQC